MRDFEYKALPILSGFWFFGRKLTTTLPVLQGWLCILWKSKQLICMFAPKSYYLIHTYFFHLLVLPSFGNEFIFPNWKPSDCSPLVSYGCSCCLPRSYSWKKSSLYPTTVKYFVPGQHQGPP